MSKNSKSAKRHAAARAVSAQRTKGNKGGGMTKRLSTKRLTWYFKKDNKLPPSLMAAVLAKEARAASGDAEE
jgi:hypothetical protein